MPELRHDPIQKRWVIIATERNLRSNDFLVEPEKNKASFCPFCEGHEDRTPSEIFAVRNSGGAPNTPGWKLRVVANKFPALKIEGQLDRSGVGLYDRMNGVGAHEVIIETPDHDAHIADLPTEQFARVIQVYRERLNDLCRDKRFKYVMIFKNHGIAAGASLAHPHTQLIATPVTPLTVAKGLQSAKDHFHLKERCLICDILAQELSSGERIIKTSDDYIAFTPYASRFPFEIFLAPRKHHHDFGQITDQDAHSLAVFFKDVMARLKQGLNDPPYNFIINTSPNTQTALHRSWYWNTIQYDWHWHIEIIPRLTRLAGFEWGSGFYINPTPPEQAANFLRELDLT